MDGSTEHVIKGRFAEITDDDIGKIAARVGLSEADVRETIREARWREAREWLDGYFRPWLHRIKGRASAIYALENLPPEWVTGDDRIDKITGAYATHVALSYAKQHEELVKANKQLPKDLLPPKRPKRPEVRAAQAAARKAAKKRSKQRSNR